MRRVGLPPGGSTLITSAPRPASVSPQYSACSSASSMTRMPASEPAPGLLSCAAMVFVIPNDVAAGDNRGETFAPVLSCRSFSPERQTEAYTHRAQPKSTAARGSNPLLTLSSGLAHQP